MIQAPQEGIFLQARFPCSERHVEWSEVWLGDSLELEISMQPMDPIFGYLDRWEKEAGSSGSPHLFELIQKVPSMAPRSMLGV